MRTLSCLTYHPNHFGTYPRTPVASLQWTGSPSQSVHLSGDGIPKTSIGGAHHLAGFSPEAAREFRIPIRHNHPGQTMHLYYHIHEDPCSIHHCSYTMGRLKNHHFCNIVHYNQRTVIPDSGLRQMHHEVHTDLLPSLFWDFQWLQQSCRSLI